jgi:hypothetical protein
MDSRKNRVCVGDAFEEKRTILLYVRCCNKNRFVWTVAAGGGHGRGEENASRGC